jgi:hypothetical protein
MPLLHQGSSRVITDQGQKGQFDFKVTKNYVSQVRDGNPKCHQLAVLSNSCYGVFVTKSMYITLKYLEQETAIVSKEEVLNRLMSTAGAIPEPAVGKHDLPGFLTDLYNFLLCNYKANDLHVDASSIPL